MRRLQQNSRGTSLDFAWQVNLPVQAYASSACSQDTDEPNFKSVVRAGLTQPETTKLLAHVEEEDLMRCIDYSSVERKLAAIDQPWLAAHRTGLLHWSDSFSQLKRNVTYCELDSSRFLASDSSVAALDRVLRARGYACGRPVAKNKTK